MYYQGDMLFQETYWVITNDVILIITFM